MPFVMGVIEIFKADRACAARPVLSFFSHFQAMNFTIRLGLIAAVLGCASQPLSAQNRTFTNQYTFGDSLSDNGNAFAASGGAAPGTAPYYVGGRWSNGPVWAERLGNTLAVGAAAPTSVKSSMGFAFGGATAVPAVSTVPFPPLPTQLQLFQSHAVAVKSTDLFTVWMGANDILNTMQAPSTPSNPGAMDTAGVNAAQATASAVQTLIGLGAKNIVVLNLPNIGATAAVGPTSGASFATRGSLAYNGEFDARLRAIAAASADVNLVRIDIMSIFNRMAADPQSLGYTGATLPAASAAAGDAAPYIYFVDGLHPSARTHAILAAVVTESLNPEPVLGWAGAEGTAALALQGLAQSAMETRIDRLAARTDGGKGVEPFLTASFGSGNRAREGYRPEFDFNSRFASVGLDGAVGDGLRLGGMIGVGLLDATVAANGGSFTVEDNGGGLYAVWRNGAFALSADAGLGLVGVRDINRTTALAGLRTKGKADGSRWGAGLRASWSVDAGGFKARPWVGIRTERIKIESYRELDAPSLAMSVEQQEAKSLAGSVGVAVGTETRMMGRRLGFDLSAAWHGELGSRDRTVSGRLADNFTRITSISLADGDGRGVALSLGATLALTKILDLTLNYTADVRDRDAVESRGVLALQASR